MAWFEITNNCLSLSLYQMLAEFKHSVEPCLFELKGTEHNLNDQTFGQSTEYGRNEYNNNKKSVIHYELYLNDGNKKTVRLLT